MGFLAHSLKPGLASRLVLALVAVPLVGLLGVVAAELVPDGRIASHLLEAREARVLGPREYEPSSLGTTTVHHSECLALSLGLGDPPGTDHITIAVQSPTYPACPRLDRQLTQFENTGRLPAGHSYLRYWHGYSTLTRPALAVVGLAGARWLAFGLLVLSAGAFYLDVRRRAGGAAALLLVAPSLLTTDSIIGGLSIVQALGIATAWLGGWLCFRLVERHPKWTTAALAAGLAGALNAYVDLMTTIPGAFTMSVVGATLGAGAVASRARAGWWIPLAASAGWVSGMVWMWASKWLIAMMFLGVSDVVDDVFGQVFFRLSGDHQRVDPSRLLGFTKNLGYWWDRPLTPWVVLVALGVLISLLVRRRSASFDRRTAISFSLTMMILVVPHVLYYMAFNSHSQIHPALVYRSLPIAFGGLAAWVLASVTDVTGDNRDGEDFGVRTSEVSTSAANRSRLRAGPDLPS